MLALYLRVTRALGERRRFIRRLAGLSLILLGVHAAADRLDDVAFAAVDRLDGVIDHMVFLVLDAIGSVLSNWQASALAHAESFANLVDVAQKERVAVVVALCIEVLIALVMLDFAWGKREDISSERRVGVVEELRESIEELKAALWPMDLERLAVVPVLVCFTTTATLLAGSAVEQIVSSGLTQVAPTWPFGVSLAAFIGLVAALLIAWRFLPDLLHGAILRAHERAAFFAQRDDERVTEGNTVPTWRRQARRVARGAFLFVGVLPIALWSVVDAGPLFALVERVGALP